MGLDEVNASLNPKRMNDGSMMIDFSVGIQYSNGAPSVHKSSPLMPESDGLHLEAVAGLLRDSPMPRVLSAFGAAIAETSAHLGLPALSNWWASLTQQERETLMRRLASLPDVP